MSGEGGSIGDAFDVAGIIEAVLNGKQPIEPILALTQTALSDFKLAVTAMQRAVAGLQTIADEIKTARK